MVDGKRDDNARGMMIGGLVALGIGVLFLLRNLGVIPGFRVLWPLFPIIVGIALILGALLRMRRSGQA
jgi:cell wall-active antibiotic response 4TMS protein YvqF